MARSVSPARAPPSPSKRSKAGESSHGMTLGKYLEEMLSLEASSQATSTASLAKPIEQRIGLALVRCTEPLARSVGRGGTLSEVSSLMSSSVSRPATAGAIGSKLVVDVREQAKFRWGEPTSKAKYGVCADLTDLIGRDYDVESDGTDSDGEDEKGNDGGAEPANVATSQTGKSEVDGVASNGVEVETGDHRSNSRRDPKKKHRCKKDHVHHSRGKVCKCDRHAHDHSHHLDTPTRSGHNKQGKERHTSSARRSDREQNKSVRDGQPLDHSRKSHDDGVSGDGQSNAKQTSTTKSRTPPLPHYKPHTASRMREKAVKDNNRDKPSHRSSSPTVDSYNLRTPSILRDCPPRPVGVEPDGKNKGGLGRVSPPSSREDCTTTFTHSSLRRPSTASSFSTAPSWKARVHDRFIPLDIASNSSHRTAASEEESRNIRSSSPLLSPANSPLRLSTKSPVPKPSGGREKKKIFPWLESETASSKRPLTSSSLGLSYREKAAIIAESGSVKGERKGGSGLRQTPVASTIAELWNAQHRTPAEPKDVEGSPLADSWDKDGGSFNYMQHWGGENAIINDVSGHFPAPSRSSDSPQRRMMVPRTTFGHRAVLTKDGYRKNMGQANYDRSNLQGFGKRDEVEYRELCGFDKMASQLGFRPHSAQHKIQVHRKLFG